MTRWKPAIALGLAVALLAAAAATLSGCRNTSRGRDDGDQKFNIGD